MKPPKADTARLRLMLMDYAAELRNEMPVLCRFTDCIPAPDGLGGHEERERDRAYRKGIMRPKDGLTLAACVDCLNALHDAPTAFDVTRDALNRHGCELLAEELTERRNRRAADIERMKAEAVKIAPSLDLPPELRVYDYDGWKAAAQTFNDGIAADIAYIQNAVAEKLVAAFADYNDRLIRAGGKPILKAAAQFTLPPNISHKGAKAVLKMLNDQVGIIPPAKLDGLTVFEIIAAFEKKYADATDICATIHQEADELQRAFAQLGDEVYDAVGRERIPPEPKDVDATSRRNLFNLIQNLDKTNHGYLDTFLNRSTWTFKGFTARQIYKDEDGLRKFVNAERMAIKRHPDET